MERLLPRHMQIIYLINAYHIDSLRAQDIHDFDVLRSVSLIEEDHGRRVRMGNLAFLGSHSVNGVSGLHTQLMRSTVFSELHKLYPDRINNKTNGITFRRWLYQANSELTSMLVDALGPQLLDNPEDRLLGLEPFADKSAFRKAFAEQRLHSKRALAYIIHERLGVAVNPAAMFDVQVKRIHEYKRQLLNVLHVVTRYLRIINNPGSVTVPRVVVFAGKAASAYHMAKHIIRLINDVAKVINNDARIGNQLKVVFIPNYSVSVAELIMPAADLSEQISTAGTEASGTGNMKLSLNGALTIGTDDGANIEIRENVGDDNIFIFGLKTPEVAAFEKAGYHSATVLAHNPTLQAVLDAIDQGHFSPDEPGRYHELVDSLKGNRDRYFLLADHASYVAAQLRVDDLYRRPDDWTRCAIANVSGMGVFSSGPTI